MVGNIMGEPEDEEYSVDEYSNSGSDRSSSEQGGSAEIDAILGSDKPPPSITIAITPDKENARRADQYKTPTKVTYTHESPPKPLHLRKNANFTPSKRLLKLAAPRESAYTLPITTPKPKKIQRWDLDNFLQRMDAAEQRRRQKIKRKQHEEAQNIICEATTVCRKSVSKRSQSHNQHDGNKNKSTQDQLQSFLQRQEAAERAKQEKIKRRSQEALYEASCASEKKHCNNCGLRQSFTEMINDNNICANDECKGKFKYERPVSFRIRTFQERMERSARRREETVKRIKEEQAMTLQVCPKSRRQKQLLAKVDAKGKDFLARMNDDVSKRRDKSNRLEEIQREQEAKKFTFQPKLNIPKELLKKRPVEQSESRRRIPVKSKQRHNTSASNKRAKGRNVIERRKAMAGTSEKIKLKH